MVNEWEKGAAEAERELALGYAPADRREALATLFALDDRLRVIVRRAREPMVGAMRLTWWADALERLNAGPAPAEPLLRALAGTVLGHGVTGVALAATVDGWERLFDPDNLDLVAFAAERGGRLFAMAGRVLGPEDERLARLGEGWALADLAEGWPELAVRTRPMAADRLGGMVGKPWPRALRALSALGLLARFDVAGETAAGSPRRVGRLLAHRLTGR